MNSARLEQLLKFLEEDPNDAFTLYAVALEYSKKNLNKAEELFDLLLIRHADYLPTYYHAAELKRHLGKTEEARMIYKRGIELAHKSNNSSALRELKSAQQELMFSND